MKNILDLTPKEARQFLLKEKSYVNFDLPSYFSFNDLIKKVSKELGSKTMAEICEPDPLRNNKPSWPANSEDVNYELLNNRDGKYAWRPFSLIHPAIYVLLVNELTETTNWKAIQDRFIEFRSNDKITCLSLPIVSESVQSDKAEQVSNWWQEVEQGSIKLGLEFEHVAHTDISDCYGSIYTHSIAWSLHGKATAKANRRDATYLGNKIDTLIQGMSNGQTNGIPQGSSLMDFIAEIVLGYADLLLSERLKTTGIEDYKILRYRDDYRIFVNNSEDAEAILKQLTEVVIELGLRLNPQKTFVADNIIKSSLKADKLDWIVNGRVASGLQNHLHILHEFAEEFPNSGALRKQLTKFHERIENFQGTDENLTVLSSIVVDIAVKNPTTFQYCSAILSKLISLMESDNDRKRIIDSVKRKFAKIPNTGFSQIWLQRITLSWDKDMEYEEPLCKRVIDSSVNIWNSDWLKEEYRNVINSTKFVNDGKLGNLGMVIRIGEVELFISSGY